MAEDKQNGRRSITSSTTTTDTSKYKIKDTPQDSGLIPTIAVTLWLGWNGFVLWIILYAIIFADKWQRMIIVGLITLSLILPPHFPGRLGTLAGNWMMRQGEKYFGLKTIIEDEQNLIEHAEEKNKAIIFAVSPHDILPYGVFAFNPVLGRLPGKINVDGKTLMTSAVFNIPFFKTCIQLDWWLVG